MAAVKLVLSLHKAFANSLVVNTKLWIVQLFKVNQLGGFLGTLFLPLIKIGLLLMNNVIILFDKSVLITLGLTTATLATNTGI